MANDSDNERMVSDSDKDRMANDSDNAGWLTIATATATGWLTTARDQGTALASSRSGNRNWPACEQRTASADVRAREQGQPACGQGLELASTGLGNRVG